MEHCSELFTPRRSSWPGTLTNKNNNDMDALTFGLMGLCRHGRDGSFATRSNREDMLTMMAADLKAGGFKLPAPASLKPKHVEFLIEHWRADGIATATMKNRMAVIRWWAEKINKASVVQRRNEDYGIGEALTAKSRAFSLDERRLAAIPCPLVRLALELQAAFGLRRDRNHHVDVIRHQVTFQDLRLFLQRQPVEHLAQVPAQFQIQCLPSTFRDEHHVIFAVPGGVA